MMRAPDTMAEATPLLLIVDDEREVRSMLAAVGRREGFAVIECDTGPAGLSELRRRHVDLMLLDLHLPGMDGLAMLREAGRTAASTHVVLVTGHATIDSAVEAIKLGAEDYLPKPIDLARLRGIMRSVRERFDQRARILDSDTALAERLSFCGMIGRSAAMTRVFDLVRRVAPHARTVLVTGETGVGKELVARALHRLGPRSERPFVTLNCAAIVDTLFESELFGHARGAFTGAGDNKPGLVEAADGGTLFLDEIGELPLALQGKLLRVLETGEVQRVGSVHGTRVDVRIVAATNRPLASAVRSGSFRSDLFYRLNVIEIAVPPLRDHPEDIPYLTAAFLREYARAFDRPISGLTPDAEALLLDAPWPGNVRQLRNAIERACLTCEGSLITDRDIAQALGAQDGAAVAGVETAAGSARTTPPSREAIADALRQANGNKAHAARQLGISRWALYRLLEKYGDMLE
jgi:DNA-binding NtrC family response regulator